MSGSATTTTRSGSCASATRSWTGCGPPHPARSVPGATPSFRPAPSACSTATPTAGRRGWPGSRPIGSCPASRTRTGGPPRWPSCSSGARCCSATSTPRSSPPGPGRRRSCSRSRPRRRRRRAARSGRSPRRCWRSANSCCCWRDRGRRLAGPAGAAAIDGAFAPLLARLAPAVGTDAGARRLHDLVDLVRAVLAGMVADGLRGDRNAYDAINHLDFRDWLRARRAAVHAPVGDRAWPVRSRVLARARRSLSSEVRRRVGGLPLVQALVPLQGRDLLEAAGRHGRDRVRADLPGAGRAGRAVPVLRRGPGAGAVGGRLPHPVGPGRPAGLAGPGAGPVPAAGDRQGASLLPGGGGPRPARRRPVPDRRRGAGGAALR